MAVDVAGSQYWIGDEGPYKLGMAATAFLAGDEDRALREELEEFLGSFGSFTSPFADGSTAGGSSDLPERVAGCAASFGYHPVSIYLVKRYTFDSLRDFLFTELGKGLLNGNAPRQCRLCGRWYFYEKSDRTIYCDRIAPGETERICRDVGARAVFEKKIQEENAWKICKRAYKKYYAWLMKGTMTQEEFKSWADEAAAERDKALRKLQGNGVRSAIAEEIFRELRERLNRK